MQISLRYKHYDLGRQPVGTRVEIVLSCINNVRLLDDGNFQAYQNGKPYKFFGGAMQKSPARLTIPKVGHWHVVVDREGFPTLANSNVRTIKTGQPHMRTVTGIIEDGRTAPDGDNGTPQVSEILKELDEYKKIANTDSLTQLNNRRAFDEKLADLFARDQKPDQVALVIADIDHFKTFNDTYGHAVGDKVLMTVAEVLRTSLGEEMFIARTGGEEFAIIIEGEELQEALRISNRARRFLEVAPFIDEGTGQSYGPITMSMGLCMADQAPDASSLYSFSDSALYASKKAGRNRCTVFSERMSGTGATSPRAMSAGS